MKSSARPSGIQKFRAVSSLNTEIVSVMKFILNLMQSTSANVVNVRELLHQVRKNQDRLLQISISFAGATHTDIENVGKCITPLTDDVTVFLQENNTRATNHDSGEDASDVVKKEILVV